MKANNVAAAALVGWYLIIAPISRDDPKTVDTSAPLNTWIILRTFGASSDCQMKVEAMRHKAQMAPPAAKQNEGNVSPSGHVLLDPDQYNARLLAAQCVATDDPRLAK